MSRSEEIQVLDLVEELDALVDQSFGVGVLGEVKICVWVVGVVRVIGGHRDRALEKK